MAPSLVALAFYRTEEAAQAALEALERKGFVIKQLLPPVVAAYARASPRAWSAAPAPVSIGLFVSHEDPTRPALAADAHQQDTPGAQGTLPADQAAPTKPHGHIAIIYDEAKEKAIKTLISKDPMQMYLY